MSWLWLSDIPITPKLTPPTLIVNGILYSFLPPYTLAKVAGDAQ